MPSATAIQITAAAEAETAVDPCCGAEPQIEEQLLRLAQPFELADGTLLEGLQVGLRLAGPAGAPVIAVLGGISAHRRPVAVPGESGEPGWWQCVLGSERVHLTREYRVLGFDFLGGCGLTTAPDNWGRPAEQFPQIDTLDQARLLDALLDELGIGQLNAIIGASYGGMVALQFAAHFPGRVRRVQVLGCAHKPEPMAAARRHVQRLVLKLAGADEASAVAAARALAMTTYRSPEEFRQRFGGESGPAEVASYLEHHGSKFSARFSRAAYLRLLDSIDNHRVEPAAIRAPLDLVAFSSDELAPPDLVEELAAAAPDARPVRHIPSIYGHDAFLCEQTAVAHAIQDFLSGASQ